jgi:hypothetical protein
MQKDMKRHENSNVVFLMYFHGMVAVFLDNSYTRDTTSSRLHQQKETYLIPVRLPRVFMVRLEQGSVVTAQFE